VLELPPGRKLPNLAVDIEAIEERAATLVKVPLLLRTSATAGLAGREQSELQDLLRRTGRFDG
jgi:hypothetical protein